MCSLDKQHDVILVLLDLCAVLDTFNHGILLERLRGRFGIRGTVLAWLISYLQGRTQRVSVSIFRFGVTQGSILGPDLFSLCMTPLENIIARHGLDAGIYADDSQLYIARDSRTDYSAVFKKSVLTRSVARCGQIY